MNALLICPGQRPAVCQLAAAAPLAGIPFLGESLVEYWLTHLADAGAVSVRILADDRPELIADVVGDGARWGLSVKVSAEPVELTLAQAQTKYGSVKQVAVLDHFPGSPQSQLFGGYSDCFDGVLEWLPKANTIDRVGIRELRPGVWAATNARISTNADLHPPCWIGKGAYVGSRARIGPRAILEDRVFVESGAAVVRSHVGPDTFVGQLAAVYESFAWGNMLLRWKNGLCARVEESFLLSGLKPPALADQSKNHMDRLAASWSQNKADSQVLWRHLLLRRIPK